MTEPRVTQVSVNFNGSGKVAIKDYGKINSGYGASISRTYEIPEDWDEAQVAAFELEKLAELHDALEPVLQTEFDERYRQRDWT